MRMTTYYLMIFDDIYVRHKYKSLYIYVYKHTCFREIYDGIMNMQNDNSYEKIIYLLMKMLPKSPVYL
jgi:hypothetical protein